MRKAIALAALAVSVLGFTGSRADGRRCDDHDGVTAATGFKIGSTQDQGRDSIDVCSDDGDGFDGLARAGARRDRGAYVVVDGDGEATDRYVYVTTGPGALGAYCGTEGDYDRPGDKDPEAEARDSGRTDTCVP